MKSAKLVFLCLLSLSGYGQTIQKIAFYTSQSMPGYNLTSDIDSIVFNSERNEMLMLVGGDINVYDITNIDSVWFWEGPGGAPHSCGAPNLHNPDLNYGSMTDQEGNQYKTIKIGNQIWMAENLNTGIYRNGDLIIHAINDNEWYQSIDTIGKWCYYNNEGPDGYACPFGKLYNWLTVSDSRKLCPAGWHVPSNKEWNTLVGYLDPQEKGIAGVRMGSISYDYWIHPLTNTNESGFSGIPGGNRDLLGVFNGAGRSGSWWSSTDVAQSSSAFARTLNFGYGVLFSEEIPKQYGINIRCVKDQ